VSSSGDDWRASRDYKRKQRERSTTAALQIRCPECKAPPHSDCYDGGGVHLERMVAADAKGKRRG